MILGGQLPGKVGRRWGKQKDFAKSGVFFVYPSEYDIHSESTEHFPVNKGKAKCEQSESARGKTVAEMSSNLGAKSKRNS